jgi:hypothetical protein
MIAIRVDLDDQRVVVLETLRRFLELADAIRIHCADQGRA